RQTRIRHQELLRLQRVTGQDENEPVSMILHRLYKRIDRFLAEVLLSATGKTVGLVDKQYAAKRFAYEIPSFLRRVSDILSDKISPLDLDEMPFREHAHLLEKLGDNAGNRCLARSGIAFEDHMVDL